MRLVFFVFSQLATWDSLHGLNGSLKESRIENGMQGVTIKVVTLLVRAPTDRGPFSSSSLVSFSKLMNLFNL